MMTVGELKELLDDYGDHVEVRAVYETDTNEQTFQITNADYIGDGVVLELERVRAK